MLILMDYTAASRRTKGFWIGCKWGTGWYRFIWSSIWVFLLRGFLGDWALHWRALIFMFGLLFTLSVPVSLPRWNELQNEISGPIQLNSESWNGEGLRSLHPASPEASLLALLLWWGGTHLKFAHDVTSPPLFCDLRWDNWSQHTEELLIPTEMIYHVFLRGTPREHQNTLGMCVSICWAVRVYLCYWECISEKCVRVIMYPHAHTHTHANIWCIHDVTYLFNCC